MKFGFKSITMDDVARELGHSKKTLYQHFKDKTDLIEQTVDNHLKEMEFCCNAVTAEPLNAIEKVIELTKMLLQNMKQVNQGAIFDLKKYYKPCWDKLENHRKDFIYKQIRQNIQQGIDEGLYYNDLDIETTTVLYTHLVQLLTDPDKFPENFSHHQLHTALVKYHLRSVCNEKGLQFLNKKINEI